jgi:hypothetical protein
MHPAMLMTLARERVRDLLRDAERERHRKSTDTESQKPLGTPYRASERLWIYSRHDSS